MYVDSNLLTSSIPDQLSDYHNLVEISLASNFLTGTFPAALNNLSFLTVLLIANNKLTGNLNQLYIPSIQTFVRDVDVSGNFFTGTIPGGLFLLPDLVSFSAFSNCLHGTLPDEICQAVSLNALVLDGVGTAKRCRRSLFPGSAYLKAFVLDKSLGGTIPACIPSLPHLNILQLSGNDLTGSLPPDMTVNQELRDLSFSHNKLTGSIPAAIQVKYFDILDLSYNRFSGVLRSDFTDTFDDCTVNLHNNRLSGTIPSAVQSKDIVNVLEGNIFTCDLSRSSLPANDPSRSIYVCGSDELDTSLYTWCACAFMALLLSLFGAWYYSGKRISATFAVLLNFMLSSMRLPMFVESGARQTLSTFFDFLAQLRKYFLIVSVVLLIVFMPMFSSLTRSYHTYEHQYGWSVSGMFLQGIVPSVVMLCLLGAFVLLFLGLMQFMEVGIGQLREKGSFTWWIRLVGAKTTTYPSNGDRSKASSALYASLAFVNILVMACVDSAYIYIFLNFNVSVVVITQIAMALLKIVWNEFALWTLVSFVHVLRESSHVLDSNTLATRWQLMAIYEYSAQDVWFVLMSTLLNNTVLPSAAIAFISSNCFYNAIIAAPVIKDLYFIFKCYLYIVAPSLDRPQCVHLQIYEVNISYEVPFQYSYQCASTMYINYIPVFVFMFVGLGLLLPLAKLGIHWYYRYFLSDNNGESSQRWKLWLRNALPHILTAPITANVSNEGVTTKAVLPVFMLAPASPDQLKTATIRKEEELSSQRTMASENSISRQSVAPEHRRLSIFACDISVDEVRKSIVKQDNLDRRELAKNSPVVDQRASETAVYSNSSGSSVTPIYRPPKLIQREKVVVQIVNYFAILLCFGTVYPPLAAIACVSFAVQSWASQYLVVSLLSRCWAVQQRGAGDAGGSEQDVVGFYADLLARQCRDVASLFGSLVLYVLPFFFLLVGYLVFDTVGYTEGWREGLWCWVLFVAWPLLAVYVFRYAIYFAENLCRPIADKGPRALEVVSTTMSPIAASAATENNVHEPCDDVNGKTRTTSRLSIVKFRDMKDTNKTVEYINEL